MIKTKTSKSLCIIATLLFLVSPLLFAKSMVQASEIDVTAEQNSRTFLQNSDQQINTAAANGEEFTKEKIANGDLVVDSTGNLSVTSQWIDRIKADLVIQGKDKDFDVYADGPAIVLVDKHMLLNPPNIGVTKLVNTWKGFDLYLNHEHCLLTANAQTIAGVIVTLVGGPLSVPLGVALAAANFLITNVDRGQGVICAFLGQISLNPPPILHWVGAQ